MNFCEPNVYFRFSRFFFLPQSLFPSSSFSIVRVFKPQRTTFVLGPSFMFFTSFSVAGSRKLQRRLRLTEDAEQNCVIGECGFYFFGGSFSSPPPPPIPSLSLVAPVCLLFCCVCFCIFRACFFFFCRAFYSSLSPSLWLIVTAEFGCTLKRFVTHDLLFASLSLQFLLSLSLCTHGQCSLCFYM